MPSEEALRLRVNVDALTDLTAAVFRLSAAHAMLTYLGVDTFGDYYATLAAICGERLEKEQR